MIQLSQLQVMAGARVLLQDFTARLVSGDKIGLVGRNGAGKTTLTKIIAGQALPAAGTISTGCSIGYLPQDPQVENMNQTAQERIFSARELDGIISKMRAAEKKMAYGNANTKQQAMERYSRLEQRFQAAGGYAAEAEAATICANLGLPEKILAQPLRTLSGGQRRRVELARILFSDAQFLLLDEPTNHLDQDSILWLRDFLKSYSGGFLVISHDVELMEQLVNKVFYLDAQRAVIDQYNMGYKAYLEKRSQDEAKRRREHANAVKKAEALIAQGEKMRAKATKAVAAQNMFKRAEKLLASVEGARAADKVAAIRFPTPVACGKTPLQARALTKSYGSTEIFAGLDLNIDRANKVVVLGFNGAGKTTLLRLLAGVEQPDAGDVHYGHGAKIGYYAQEHETLDGSRTVLENLVSAAAELDDTQARTLLGSFLFSGDDVHKAAGVLSGGEKTRLALAILVASGANVLLLDEPTNNLDPASRAEILDALTRYEGAVVLVTHDEGAVKALNPERVLILPDGVEDYWSADYEELITLA